MRVPLAAVLAASVAWGCGTTDRSDERGPEAPPATPPAAPPVRDLTPPPLPAEADLPRLPVVDAITLEAAGKGRRQLARYRPTAGFEARLTARLTAHERAGADDTGEQALPPIHYGLRVSGASAHDHGFRLQVVGLPLAIDDGDHGELARERMRGYREHVARVRAWIDIDDRGAVTGAGGVGAANADDDVSELERLYFDYAIPLPAEAIAPGARWKVVSRVLRGGVVVKRTTTLELIARDGDRLRVRVLAREVGERQLMSARGLPAGVTAELLAMVWQLDGEVEIDLARPFASGEIRFDQRYHGRVYHGDPPLPTDTYAATTGVIETRTAAHLP